MIEHPIEAPTSRLLRIFAFDPMQADARLSTITVDVSNEQLTVGPSGERIEVIDYDATRGLYYPPVNLDDSAILMQSGLAPSEADPRFHQQMVYAVAMKVLENFDRALGRRITFKQNKKLRLFPHAFREANAFFDPKLTAVCFGYFMADREQPGRNLPGQTVFTCLSQDIIAHEVTHALVHRMREFFLVPTNDDVLAFHEGFADIVAIFQHFTFPSVLSDAIRKARGALHSADTLVDLATQFGHATGKNDALRSALDPADPRRYANATEPHERGSILVAAVFEAFYAIYQDRSRDLVRIATSGTGVLPEGDLLPDLVERLSREAAKAAQEVLTMCIRAFEYLPPRRHHLRGLPAGAGHGGLRSDGHPKSDWPTRGDRGVQAPRHLPRRCHLALGGCAPLAHTASGTRILHARLGRRRSTRERCNGVSARECQARERSALRRLERAPPLGQAQRRGAWPRSRRGPHRAPWLSRHLPRQAQR